MVQTGPHRIDIPTGDPHRSVRARSVTLSIGHVRCAETMPFPRMTAFVVVVASATSLLIAPVVRAQTSLSGPSPFETNEDRDIFNNLPDSNRQGSVLDATNPMELIQRLRQATSMNDATDPVDAIDAALREFNQP